MNYDQQITHLIEAIKADKSIIQPWRNKAVARLEEAHAFIRMGKTSSGQRYDEKLVVEQSYSQTSQGCTCFPGTVDKSCPVHGG